eukprot:scaffold6918_cov158-Amphora_coffeaeformis.AAC.2
MANDAARRLSYAVADVSHFCARASPATAKAAPVTILVTNGAAAKTSMYRLAGVCTSATAGLNALVVGANTPRLLSMANDADAKRNRPIMSVVLLSPLGINECDVL